MAATFGLKQYGAVLAVLQARSTAMQAAGTPIRLRGLPDFPEQAATLCARGCNPMC